jgi:hypothetical protein
MYVLETKSPEVKHTKYWKTSFLATKSVSQFNSTTTALLSSCATASKPSAAVRADFFAANTTPRFLRSFWASSENQLLQMRLSVS